VAAHAVFQHPPAVFRHPPRLATFRLKIPKDASNRAGASQENPLRLTTIPLSVRRGWEVDSEICFGLGDGRKLI
jgi:hypothetical protein